MHAPDTEGYVQAQASAIKFFADGSRCPASSDFRLRWAPDAVHSNNSIIITITDLKGRVKAAAVVFPDYHREELVVDTVCANPRAPSLGKHIVYAALDEARRLGKTYVRLHAIAPVLGFYQRFGFAYAPDPETNSLEDGFTHVRSLRNPEGNHFPIAAVPEAAFMGATPNQRRRTAARNVGWVYARAANASRAASENARRAAVG